MTRPNFTQLCRLCVLKDSSFANIFEVTGNLEIRVADIINELLELDVRPGDGLPEIICCACLNELARFKRFKNISHEARHTLESIIKGTSTPLPKPSTSSKDNVNQQVEIVDLLDSDDESSNDSGAETVAAPSPPPFQEESEKKIDEDQDRKVVIEASSSKGADLRESSFQQISRKIEATALEKKVFDAVNDISSDPLAVEEKNVIMQSSSLSDNESVIEIDDMEAEIVELETEDTNLGDGEIAPGQCSRTMGFFRIPKRTQINADNSSENMEVEENLSQDAKNTSETSDEDDSDSLTCPKCMGTFENGYELKNHMKRLDCRGFVCSKCGKVHFSERELQKHVKYCGFVCGVCNQRFPSELSLRNHKTVHTETEIFECDKCDKIFTSSSALIGHKAVHTKKNIKCAKCNLTFSCKRSMVTHSKKCKIPKMDLPTESEFFYKCGYCESAYKTFFGFRSHFVKHGKGGGAICGLCKKEYKSANELRIHVSDFHGVLKCGLCSKKFMDTYHLKRHLITHFDERPYKCSKCNSSFKIESALDVHFSRIHGK